MAHHDLGTAEKPLTVEEATATLHDLSQSALTLRLQLTTCPIDLLLLIAGRFPELKELTIHPQDPESPFGDVVISREDFETEKTMGLSTDQAIGVTMGYVIGVRPMLLFSTYQSDNTL